MVPLDVDAFADSEIVAGAVNDAPFDGDVNVTVGGVGGGGGGGAEGGGASTVTVLGADCPVRPPVVVALATML